MKRQRYKFSTRQCLSEKANKSYFSGKGSAFFENERKRNEAVTKRINAMLEKYEKLRNLNLTLETQVVDNMVRTVRLP